ncbi:MAG: hypothetical protein OQK82_08405 [Candidatus Pacearchaeota archaeon]|nr:hypothetical protein [Candidatus Pacearchaeota archaeon]
MAFIQQINCPREIIPVRAYVHESWNYSANGNPQKYFLKGILDSKFCRENNPEYILAEIWFDEKARLNRIELFKYWDVIDKWPGDPDEIHYSGMGEGLWLDKAVSTGSLTSLRAEEEKYRRKMNDLQDYFENPLPIDILRSEGLWKD